MPGQELAKTVVIKLDGELALCVLPATYQIDFDQLRELLGTERVELADESEFKDRFPGCELGAMPPFGNLYGMRTYVADTLCEDEQIAFNAGSHTVSMILDREDYLAAAAPADVFDFSRP